MRRLRPVFDGHFEVVVTVAVTLSLACLLTASLITSRYAAVPVVALSGCAAAVHVGYLVRPKARLRRAARIGLRRGEFHVVYQPIVDCARDTAWAWKRCSGGAIPSSESGARGCSLENSKAPQGYWIGKPMAVDQLRAFASASINTLQDGTGTELKA